MDCSGYLNSGFVLTKILILLFLNVIVVEKNKKIIKEGKNDL